MQEERWEIPEQIKKSLVEKLVESPSPGFNKRVMQLVKNVVKNRQIKKRIWVYLGVVWLWTGGLISLLFSLYSTPLPYEPLLNPSSYPGLNPFSALTTIIFVGSILGAVELSLMKKRKKAKSSNDPEERF